MAFLTKIWRNAPDTSTPISAAALEDVEARVTAMSLGGVIIQNTNSGSYNAVPGDVVYGNPGSGGFTVNLPAPAQSTSVTVLAGPLVSGSNRISISYASPNIFGQGLPGVGVATFYLGYGGSYVTLTSDGISWYIVRGAQDTGWQALSLAGALTQQDYTPAARLIADRVLLRGSVTTTSGFGVGATVFTVPSGLNLRPTAQIVSIGAKFYGSATPTGVSLNINTDGTMTPNIFIPSLVGITLNGCSYSPGVS